MEALLLFGGAVFWTIAAIVVFGILCFVADLAEKGYIAFIAFLALIGLYWWQGDIKAFWGVFTWANIIIYVALGFLYSLLRTYIAGRKLAKKLLTVDKDERIYIGDDSYSDRESAIRGYIRTDLAGNVFRWWFLWVISLIDWIIGDFLKDIFEIIFRYLKDMYKNLLMAGIKSILGEKVK